MLLTTAIVGVSSFLLLPSVPVTPPARHTRLFATEQEEGNFFTGFFTELDNFVDDATARRLGNGSEVSALGDKVRRWDFDFVLLVVVVVVVVVSG